MEWHIWWVLSVSDYVTPSSIAKHVIYLLLAICEEICGVDLVSLHSLAIKSSISGGVGQRVDIVSGNMLLRKEEYLTFCLRGTRVLCSWTDKCWPEWESPVQTSAGHARSWGRRCWLHIASLPTHSSNSDPSWCGKLFACSQAGTHRNTCMPKQLQQGVQKHPEALAKQDGKVWGIVSLRSDSC